MRRRPLAAAALVACLANVALAAESPRTIVEKMTQAAIDILGQKSLSSEEKRHRIEDLAYANIDFETMSRLVLARNWGRLSAAQQEEFVKLFREHLALTYGRHIG